VPTAHRRHAITETDDISDALELAGRTWPDLADKPAALLRKLILSGCDALSDDHAAVEQRRREAIAATSGALSGAFGADYVSRLREDWPQ
jgi:hypothetical protein